MAMAPQGQEQEHVEQPHGHCPVPTNSIIATNRWGPYSGAVHYLLRRTHPARPLCTQS